MSASREKLIFGEPNTQHDLTCIQIFVEKDGHLHKKARGLITKRALHPCFFSVAVGESFYASQVSEIAQYMFRVDMNPPEAKEPRPRRGATRQKTSGGGGVQTKPRGRIVVTLRELEVGDTLFPQTNHVLADFYGAVVSTHKKYRASGKVGVVMKSGKADVIQYGSGFSDTSFEIDRPAR